MSSYFWKQSCVCAFFFPLVTMLPISRKPQKKLVHAREVGASQPCIENVFSGVRIPMYKANDSDDPYSPSSFNNMLENDWADDPEAYGLYEDW